MSQHQHRSSDPSLEARTAASPAERRVRPAADRDMSASAAFKGRSAPRYPEQVTAFEVSEWPDGEAWVQPLPDLG